MAGEARSGDEWLEGCIGIRPLVAVESGVMDGGLGAPEIVVILDFKSRDRSIADRHIEDREIARVFGKRFALRGERTRACRPGEGAASGYFTLLKMLCLQ